MLSNLIHTIKSDPDRYGCHLWDYRISGNTLELSVKADHRQNPEEYRMSVIKIGQVLQAIDCKAVLAGKLPQIQSFPSFNESQLVAQVRLHRFFNSGEPYNLPNGIKSEVEGSMPVLLKSIASHFGLFFHNHTGREADKVANLMNLDPEKWNGDNRFYAICTATDNPFVWLKAGKWVERVQQLVEDDPSVPLPLINFCIPKEERTVLNSAFEACSYLQALVRVD